MIFLETVKSLIPGSNLKTEYQSYLNTYQRGQKYFGVTVKLKIYEYLKD
jgi:hypothetical protein